MFERKPSNSDQHRHEPIKQNLSSASRFCSLQTQRHGKDQFNRQLFAANLMDHLQRLRFASVHSKRPRVEWAASNRQTCVRFFNCQRTFAPMRITRWGHLSGRTAQPTTASDTVKRSAQTFLCRPPLATCPSHGNSVTSCEYRSCEQFRRPSEDHTGEKHATEVRSPHVRCRRIGKCLSRRESCRL